MDHIFDNTKEDTYTSTTPKTTTTNYSGDIIHEPKTCQFQFPTHHKFHGCHLVSILECKTMCSFFDCKFTRLLTLLTFTVSFSVNLSLCVSLSVCDCGCVSLPLSVSLPRPFCRITVLLNLHQTNLFGFLNILSHPNFYVVRALLKNCVLQRLIL